MPVRRYYYNKALSLRKKIYIEIFYVLPKAFYWLDSNKRETPRCTWRHLWRKSVVKFRRSPPLFLFNPLPIPELCVRNSGWNVAKEARENQGEVGWDQARRVNQSRPVGRPNNPVRPLETGRIRGGRPTSIDPNVHVTRFVIILNYMPGSSFQTDSRESLSCWNISVNFRLFWYDDWVMRKKEYKRRIKSAHIYYTNLFFFNLHSDYLCTCIKK